MGDEPSTPRREELTRQWENGELTFDEVDISHETVDPESVELEVEDDEP